MWASGWGWERLLPARVSGLLLLALPIGHVPTPLGDTSACCVVTESDPELEVEYRESREPDLAPTGLDSTSLSDADTVNPDEDSFSILGGDSPFGPESLMHDLPPLFLHLTCSVRLRGQHSSVPVCSLPTCLGEFRGPRRMSQYTFVCMSRSGGEPSTMVVNLWHVCCTWLFDIIKSYKRFSITSMTC